MKVSDLTQKYIGSSIVVFILLAGGQGTYPEQGVNRLKEVVKDNEDHFQFAAICLGEITPAMTKITTELDGKSGVATSE
jgi:hypothetical protein